MCGASGGEGNHSSCGTYFNANKEAFPSVPYSSLDFNDDKCRTANEEIENYNNVFQVKKKTFCLNESKSTRYENSPHLLSAWLGYELCAFNLFIYFDLFELFN